MTRPSDTHRTGPGRKPAIVELSDTDKPDQRTPPDPASQIFDQPGLSPADAPPVEDGFELPPTGLELAARLAARPVSPLTRLFLGSAFGLVLFLAGMAVLRFIQSIMISWPILGMVAIGLAVLFMLAVLLVAGREVMAFRRLARLDAIRDQAAAALIGDGPEPAQQRDARAVLRQLDALYAHREDMGWHRERLTLLAAEIDDPRALLSAAESTLLAPLDIAARREVEAAARLVAATTALIPLAFVDIAAAMLANLRMIRRLAEIYGGRAGWLGGWRLTRVVLAHLVATGAVAAGDDLIPAIAGGGALAKLSRRFGEGVVNGALTARVGIAAIEVCRPLPFLDQPRPKVRQLLGSGLKGLFSRD